MDYLYSYLCAALDVVKSGRCACGSPRICHLLDRLSVHCKALVVGFVAAHNGSCSSGMDGASWKWPEREGLSGSLCWSRRFALRWRFIPPPLPLHADQDDNGLFRLISRFFEKSSVTYSSLFITRNKRKNVNRLGFFSPTGYLSSENSSTRCLKSIIPYSKSRSFPCFYLSDNLLDCAVLKK